MGGVIVIIILVAIFAGFIFLSTKINNLKYRAKQQVLKNTGISSSNINSSVTDMVEKRHMESFLKEHSDYTEDSIRAVLRQYSDNLISKSLMDSFGEKVKEKKPNGSKLDKLSSMNFVKASINFYKADKLNAINVYSDGRDEYNIYLYFDIINNNFVLQKYQVAKGAVVGF